MNPRLGKVNRGGQVASCNNNSWSSSPRSPMQPEPVLNTVIVLNVLKPKTTFFTEYKKFGFTDSNKYKYSCKH